MASLLSGFEYDIFISYRRKDNKHDGWVTEFVNQLNGELESTFKDEISVYFDSNPHDGLLETHDVDASLKEKLKCLIFIPIVSHTYCDPGSFAWENEFKAFAKQALKDQIGLKVRLLNGNVTSRILPIKIHDLDPEDKKLLENELGGVIRGIDFIYKSAGVNRPLRSYEESPQDNINKTFYRNQINKVANVIKEIISGLKGEPINAITKQKKVPSTNYNTHIPVKSIAVLPFLNMSSEKNQDYFCDGITEEIINTLAHIESFKVIARTSAFAFKDKQVDIREIGSILGVEALLEGSIKKEGNRLRITAQLIKVADGSHIWSEHYDREMKDVFVIQDEISLAIVDKLKVKLLGEQERMIAKRHSENLEAYSLYLKGIYCYQMLTAERLNKASEYFKQALQKDPDYALAYVGLGYVSWLSSMWGNVPPNEAYPKANEYVNKALKIDNTLAEAYSGLATINTFYYWNWEEAERNFKQALKINPNSSMIHNIYSAMLIFTRRFEEAISEAKLARELDPLSGFISSRTGLALTYAGQCDTAIEEYKVALKLDPNHFFIHFNLGNAYYKKAMFKAAMTEYKKAVDLSNGTSFAITMLAVVYYQLGKKDKAEKLFESLKKRSETEYVDAASFYMIHRARGEEDLAFECLERACNEHDSFILWLRPDPLFVPEDSRYMALLQEFGL